MALNLSPLAIGVIVVATVLVLERKFFSFTFIRIDSFIFYQVKSGSFFTLFYFYFYVFITWRADVFLMCFFCLICFYLFFYIIGWLVEVLLLNKGTLTATSIQLTATCIQLTATSIQHTATCDP